MAAKYGPVGKLIFVSGHGRGEEDRWQIVDRVGMERRDYTIHNGDLISVKWHARWVELQAWSDGETWVFKRPSGRQINWNPREFPCRLRE